MGQELLEHRGYQRTRTRYFLATSSNGLRAVRGSGSKVYTHACIATEPSDWGWVTSLWSSRLDLAIKNVKTYERYYNGSKKFEAVPTVEITAKEARLIKKEINLEAEKAKLAKAQEALNEYQSTNPIGEK